MSSLLANTTNHRRAIMFIAALLFGVLTDMVFYKIPLGFREFIIPPVVGLFVFESLFRTRKWLSLKTLPLYIVVLILIDQVVYGILYSISYGTMANPLESLGYLFTDYSYLLYFLIETAAITGLAYYLITIYKHESWMIQEQQATDKTSNEPVFQEGAQPEESSGWLQKYEQQLIGFFGWFVIASLVVPFSIGLITTPVTIICLLSFAASKKYKGVAGGILVAVALNFFVSLVRGLSMNAYCFMPFYYDGGF